MTCDVALKFIYSAFSAAMGCLFACFRVRTDDARFRPTTHLVSQPAVSTSRRNFNSPNQFTSLLESEEHDGSPCKNEINPPSFQQTEISDRDLLYEAKFLKACGVLVETPDEIRKSREKLQNSEEGNLDSGSPQFHSWYPHTSLEKLCLEKEGRVKSLEPLKLCEWQDTSSEHSTDSVSSCDETRETEESMADEKKSQLPSLTSPVTKKQVKELHNSPVMNSPQLHSTVVKSRAKSVHFARETRLLKVEMPGFHGALEYSPHPTPLKLTDEMQTPGTIYATNLDSATRGRNARIRSQYVYAALNSVDNISQLRMLKEEEAEEVEVEAVMESSENLYDTHGYSSAKEYKDSVNEDSKVEATFSAWLRPPPSNIKNKTNTHEAIHNQNLGLTPGSRPILGVLPPSYWNSDGSSDASTKSWDGNGIPNTTTKYKEDQKVRWHATPFEERLEKALSVEGSVPDRRQMDGIPIVYEDKEVERAESPVQQLTLHAESDLPFIERRIDIVS